MTDAVVKYQQKILFGCPGTGKSHKVDNEILDDLGIDKDSDNVIKCVFHPEYTYGDFMGKLMPLTKNGTPSYNYYIGHLLRAVALACKNFKTNEENPARVVLVIDEINRGNTAAIFGSIIQLLDRDDNGWSSYAICLSDMEHQQLLSEILSQYLTFNTHGKLTSKVDCDKLSFIDEKKLKLPPNFYIVGTMNTSDESIYYMDSAFKRRWDWEYIDLKEKGTTPSENLDNWIVKIGEDEIEWCHFVDKLNDFIKDQAGSIRRVEDKQIGYWFIKATDNETISEDQIKNKLMFFLWDSVFQRDKSPLATILKVEAKDLVTFGDFTARSDDFINAIIARESSQKPNTDSE